MIMDIVLYTVPHSGTRFTMEYFRHLGFDAYNPGFDDPIPRDGKILFTQQHAGILHKSDLREDVLYANKVIVTVTHPYRNFISFLGRPNKTFDMLVECWDDMLDTLGDIDYYVFDINCCNSERFEHLYGMIRHVGLDNDSRLDLTQKFVDDWPTVAANESKFKDDYLRDGTLPAGYDYNELYRAVRWYEKLPTNDY